jgi:hypothetical protein
MTTKSESSIIEEEPDEKKDPFRLKNEWKSEPGKHFLPGEPTPLDGFEIASNPQADLVLDWA